MNKKKICSILISASLLFGTAAPAVYAQDANGRIDLYEIFSNKEDQMKTEVGSRIYKWSMHLPDDAVIFKSDRANNFQMSTKSYNSSVELNVVKNKDELTLEELLYKMQNGSKRRRYREWGDKEFVIDIAKDSAGQKYLRIIKTDKIYDRFLMDDTAEELGAYIENRIYIENNYIYNLNINMNGEFYRQHEEMFDKLSSSFRLSFDEENPYIKELSDSVSSTRKYENTSYGWNLEMSPYWKLDGSPNARYQKFCAVYSDEELNADKEAVEEIEDEFKVPEEITVSLIGSAEKDETSSKWAQKEIKELKENYNSEAYEILRNKEKKQGDTKVHHVVVRYKTVTKKPYIVHNLYAVGNGYKYLVSATMMEDKYEDTNKRSAYENMINSFVLDKESISEYLGKITEAKTLINLNAPKELKMKKYDFKTEVTKSWNAGDRYDFEYFGGFDNYFDDYFYESRYRGNVSNSEYLDAFDPISNTSLNMRVSLDTEEMKEIIKNRAKWYLEDDQIKMGLLNIKIKSAKYSGAELYYIEREYDLDAINKFIAEDETKVYDLEELQNEYEYIIKIGKDIYTQSVNLPVANMTDKNMTTVKNIWKNTTINKVNYGKKNLQWKDHKLEEFDEDKDKNK